MSSAGPSALACACRVDANTDRRISAQEMQRWIMAKSAEHLREAVQESRAHFRAVDPDGDGEAEPLSPDVPVRWQVARAGHGGGAPACFTGKSRGGMKAWTSPATARPKTSP